MMRMEALAQKFEEYDTNRINEYLDLLSTQEGGEIFPPYIPHVGDDYAKYRILMYGMAQNIGELWEELAIKNRSGKVKQLFDAKEIKDVWIAPYEVMLATAGVYIFAKFGNRIKTLDEVHNSIAVTNYYKFSLHKDNRDINPNSRLPRLQSPAVYWDENDKLAKMELEVLKPSVVFGFNGRHNEVIKSQGYNFVTANDPSWILRGGSGALKRSGSWYRELDCDVYSLVCSYVESIKDSPYAGKKEAIRVYLLKYYSDWKAAIF